MKILHTSDWHLGIKVPSLEISRLEEQAKILEKIKKIIEEEKIDVVLISGDIFETSLPSVEAERVFLQFISDIAGDLKKHVFLINGNHDSNEKIQNLNILSKVFNNRIKAFTELKNKAEELIEGITVILDDITFIGIPFIPRYMYSGEYRNTFEIILCRALEKATDTAIIFSHDTLQGAIYSDTEVKYDDKSLDPNSIKKLPNFNKVIYWAVGHIHKHQKIAEDIWYSGSIIQTNFGERDQSKYVIICEINDKSTLPNIKSIELPQEFLLKQYVIQNEEEMERMLKEYKENWYVKVIIRSSSISASQIEKIKTSIKNSIIVQDRVLSNNFDPDIENMKSLINDPIEMYRKYCEQNNIEVSDKEIEYLRRIYDEIYNEMRANTFEIT